MTQEKNADNKEVMDIYEYIKSVDEKVKQNDKTLKFLSSLQSEQMKELINSKSDNLKKFFEDAIRLQVETMRNAYEEIIENLQANYEKAVKAIEIKNLKTINKEYEERIFEVKMWHEKNLQNKLEEQKNYLYAEMDRRCNESYQNGKAEVEAWHEEIVRKKLEVQAAYFHEEIEKAKQQVKKEMYEEMDEAARRNEAELKLFLDYYENKIKPFKGLISAYEEADRKIKDINRRIRNKFNKIRGREDLVVSPDMKYAKCVEKAEQLKQQSANVVKEEVPVKEECVKENSVEAQSFENIQQNEVQIQEEIKNEEAVNNNEIAEQVSEEQVCSQENENVEQDSNELSCSEENEAIQEEIKKEEAVNNNEIAEQVLEEQVCSQENENVEQDSNELSCSEENEKVQEEIKDND